MRPDSRLRRRGATGIALLVAFLVLGACARTGADSHDARSGVQASSRAGPDEAAFREVFEETVPTIEAALPLATVVEHVSDGKVKDIRRAWFSNGQPVCMRFFTIDQGETTSTDAYYYQQGRLVAWSIMFRTPAGDPRGLVLVEARAAFESNGAVRWAEVAHNGTPADHPLEVATGLRRVFADSEAGFLEIFSREAKGR